MTFVANCPFGFEDGHIIAYSADSSKVEVVYEFWNEERRTIIFDGLVGLRDYSAIGVTVGAVAEIDASDLINVLCRRRFEVPPAGLGWRHYQFLDLDDQPMFEVVAEQSSLAPAR